MKSIYFQPEQIYVGVLHFTDNLLIWKADVTAPDGHKINSKTKYKMEKKNTITIRLSDEQYGWLRALSRRSKRSQSEVVRSLIEQGTVRERITRENLDIIRKLIGESTNLNQLAKQANKQGFFRVRDECQATALKISQLIKRIKDDR